MKALEEAGEDTEELRRQYLLRRFWQAATGFWGKRAPRMAWILSGTLLLIIFLNIAASYGMNLWNRAIFDALEKKDANTVLFLSVLYFVILAASVSVNVAQVYARMSIQRRWRRWLTDNLADRWLASGRYYQLNLVSGDHQNPEYRIADDVRIATESPVDFVSGVTTAFLSAATFIVVLWTIGGALDFSIGGVPHLRTGLSRDSRGDLRAGGERIHAAHRPPLRRRLGGQEPVRSRDALRPHAAARER